ncbi:hypothetical protein TNCV_1777081 [Trichonephila clavipes]|nr:hypothetical protein TNCV_1777081 [Trichonephila clavipes]
MIFFRQNLGRNEAPTKGEVLGPGPVGPCLKTSLAAHLISRLGLVKELFDINRIVYLILTSVDCRLGSVVGLSLAFWRWRWFRPRPKLVDFLDAENQQRPCRMNIRHEKNPLSVHLAWMLSAKLNS